MCIFMVSVFLLYPACVFSFWCCLQGQIQGGGGSRGSGPPPFCRHVIERDHQQIRSIHAGCLNNLLNFELNFYLKMH